MAPSVGHSCLATETCTRGVYLGPSLTQLVPVVQQRLIPTVQNAQKTAVIPQFPKVDNFVDMPVAAQKTVENPQVQFLDQAVDDPTVCHHQAPTDQKVQKTVDIPHIEFVDRAADAPAVSRPVQKPADVPQLQYIDKLVDVPFVTWRPVATI